ncbi:MAG: transcriptional regulator [Bacteroidetes bacterium]|nr:MAG: transcriptional regulator [Bacteroidota bacterium]REK04791.1 MAG: transcriptional regulator [Bacteroidota bacterium]REK36264.1 MAG: transcriptional regulator [Bacteroidota bacterium]REK51072.1 MAG: transcriptional regulator [Bacteroidota bacterium]
MKFKSLDPLLHSQLRLAIMSILISVKSAEFGYIREKTEASSGNISVQLSKLAEAGYIEIEKSFRDNYPLTTCSITAKGVTAFEDYVNSIQSYLSSGN